MNKKGFTLVELLAVIVILGIISTIAIVSLTGVRKNIDLKTVQSNLDLVLVAAKSYGEDHISEIMNREKTILVKNLKKDTELTIPDEYDNISVKIFYANYRAKACIYIKKVASGEVPSNQALIKLIGNDYKTKEEFKKYWCN